MSDLGRHVQTIFCDDVRQEVGNKNSLMGVYAAEMKFSSLPTIVPQLCVLVQVRTPKDRPIRSLQITVTLGEATLANFIAPPESLPTSAASVSYFSGLDQDDELGCLSIGAAFHIMGFSVAIPGAVRVHVIADGEKLVAQGLHITGPDVLPAEL